MFTGKTAIVTGASRGIGRAIALELAKNGANIIVNYAGNQAKAEEVVSEIKAIGQEAVAIQTNVANEDEVKTMIKETVDRFGSVDILVNNAGITKDNLVMRMKESDWDDVLDINLKGVFLCAKALVAK